MPWYITESPAAPEDQRKLLPWGALSLSVSLVALILAAMHFLDGELWDGVRRLAFAVAFAVVGVKGSGLRSSDPVWVKLIVGAAFLVYLVLSVMKYVVEP